MIEAESAVPGTTKPATAVRAIAITIGALNTSPGGHGGFPPLSAPTMLIACPDSTDSLTPPPAVSQTTESE